MYVNKKIAEHAVPPPPDPYASTERPAAASATGESHTDIARSCREMLSSFEDPTILLQLQKELAVRDERYPEAAQLHEKICYEMTHNPVLRVVVAMEAALSDHRWGGGAHA